MSKRVMGFREGGGDEIEDEAENDDAGTVSVCLMTADKRASTRPGSRFATMVSRASCRAAGGDDGGRRGLGEAVVGVAFSVGESGAMSTTVCVSAIVALAIDESCGLGVAVVFAFSVGEGEAMSRRFAGGV